MRIISEKLWEVKGKIKKYLFPQKLMVKTYF